MPDIKKHFLLFIAAISAVFPAAARKYELEEPRDYVYLDEDKKTPSKARMAAAAAAAATAAGTYTTEGGEVLESFDDVAGFSYSADRRARRGGRRIGIELGLGTPVLAAGTGINGFIGYAKRGWGVRGDFQIPLKVESSLDISMKASGASALSINPMPLLGGGSLYMDSSDVASANFSLWHQNFGALLDWYPFDRGSFFEGIRLTAGYYAGQYGANVYANSFAGGTSDSVKIPFGGYSSFSYLDVRFTGDKRLSTNFIYGYHGPYVGVGYKLGVWAGIGFYVDAGVIFSYGGVQSRTSEVATTVNTCLGTDCDVLAGGNDIADAISATLAKQMIDKMDAATIIGSGFYALKAGLGGNYDYDGIAAAVRDYIKNPGTPIGGNPGSIIKALLDLGAFVDTDGYKAVLQTLKNDFNTPGQPYSEDTLQAKIDQAYDNYQLKATQGLDMYMKDIRLIPTIKLGMVYRF